MWLYAACNFIYVANKILVVHVVCNLFLIANYSHKLDYCKPIYYYMHYNESPCKYLKPLF